MFEMARACCVITQILRYKIQGVGKENLRRGLGAKLRNATLGALGEVARIQWVGTQGRGKPMGADDLVLATSKGTPLSAKNLRNRVLEPKRKALGLPRLSWHVFRYTHATWLSEAQVPARIAQSILGHSDVSMTLNVYTQVVPESQRMALEKIGAILDPNGPKCEPNENSGSVRVNQINNLEKKW